MKNNYQKNLKNKIFKMKDDLNEDKQISKKTKGR